MTYYRRGDGFGALPVQMQAIPLVAMPTTRASVVRAMRTLPRRPNVPSPLAQIEQIRAIQQRRVQVVRALLASPTKTLQTQFATSGVLCGFASFDEARHTLGAAADAASEWTELSGVAQNTIGQSMLFSRGAEIASSLGLPFAYDDVLEYAQSQISMLSGLDSVGGGLGAQAVLQQMFGGQVSSSFLAQGESLSNLLGIAQQVREKFGTAWGDVTEVVGDLSGIMDGGVRSVMESLSTTIGDQSAWLNETSVKSVVGIARTWSSEVDYGRPGSIVGGVGGTIALAGAACPPPANAIVVAVGGVIGLIGSLIDLIMGNPRPDPEAKPCAYTTLTDADAWAVLRLYLYATGEVGADVPLSEVARVGSRGYGARFDPYTGEVLVQTPGSGSFRRILDVFNRRVILDAYEGGAFNEWLLGTRSIQGADPVQVTGSPWLSIVSGQPYELRRALYCSLDKSRDTIQRGFGAMVCSTARRFRVYDEEYGVDVNARRDHGPKAIGWAGKMEQPATGPFWLNYRAGMLVSAFLGGTTPHGRYDTGAICSGVGGKTDPNTGRFTYPFTVVAGTKIATGTDPYGFSTLFDMTRTSAVLDSSGRPVIAVAPPAARATPATGVTVADATTPGLYTPAAGGATVLGSFQDVARAVLTSETQRLAWNVPARTPEAGEIAPEGIMISDVQRSVMRWIPTNTDLLAVLTRTSKGEPLSSDGKSEGGAGKAALLVLGALALGGGGLWAYNSYRRNKRNR